MDPHLSPGEARELAAAFSAHAKDVFVHACFLTRGDTALAEDLVQQAFQAAAGAWSALRVLGEDKLRAWLRSTTRNLAVSEFRHNSMAKSKHADIEQEYRGPEADTSSDALNNLALERCWQVITEMPARRHMIALMYWFLRMKQSEIAEELGIAPGTVAAQIHSAREKLRAALKERDPFVGDDIHIEELIPHPGEEARRHD